MCSSSAPQAEQEEVFKSLFHVLVSNNSVTERYKTDRSRFNFGDNNFKFVAHIRQKLHYPECTGSDDSSANYCVRSWYLLSVVVMEIS